MRQRMAASLLAVLPTLAFAQTLAPKPSAVQYITVVATPSVASAAPGSAVTLWVDVTPKPGVHVYASDSQGTKPVALVLTPRAGVTAGKPKLPPAEMIKTVGTTETVAAYRKPFRIEQPITIAPTAKAGEAVTIAGVVNYQACDDAVCYPPGAVPLSWTVTVK